MRLGDGKKTTIKKGQMKKGEGEYLGRSVKEMRLGEGKKNNH